MNNNLLAVGFFLMVLGISAFALHPYIASDSTQDLNTIKYGEGQGITPYSYSTEPETQLIQSINQVFPTLSNLNIVAGTNISIVNDKKNSKITINSIGGGSGGLVYTGISPIVVDNDANTIALNTYIPTEADIDNNAFGVVNDLDLNNSLTYVQTETDPIFTAFDVNSNFVPYVGAITDVNLNSKNIINVSNIGIGLNEPLSALHIFQSFAANNTQENIMYIDRNVDAGAAGASGIASLLKFRVPSLVASGGLQTGASIGYKLGANINQSGMAIYNDTGDQRFFFSDSNRLGVNVLTPQYAIDVNDNATTNGAILSLTRQSRTLRVKTLNNPSGLNIGTVTDTNLGFFTKNASTPDLFLGVNHAVGVGTTNPMAALHIQTGGSNQDFRITDNAPTWQFQQTQTSNENWNFQNYAGTMLFKTDNDSFTSGAVKMTLNQNGYLLIDPSASISSQAPSALTVRNGDANFQNVYIGADAQTANLRITSFNGKNYIESGQIAGDSTADLLFTSMNGTTNKAVLTADGNFGIGTSFTAPNKLYVAGDINATTGYKTGSGTGITNTITIMKTSTTTCTIDFNGGIVTNTTC